MVFWFSSANQIGINFKRGVLGSEPVLPRKMVEEGAMRARLEYELEAMKRISKQGLELEVQWLPREDGPLSGEVKGDVIYIYESEEKKALDVLEHEFVDYLVAMGIDPFKLMVNSLIKLVNRMAYLNKEKSVEALRALLKERREGDKVDSLLSV